MTKFGWLVRWQRDRFEFNATYPRALGSSEWSTLISTAICPVGANAFEFFPNSRLLRVCRVGPNGWVLSDQVVMEVPLTRREARRLDHHILKANHTKETN